MSGLDRQLIRTTVKHSVFGAFYRGLSERLSSAFSTSVLARAGSYTRHLIIHSWLYRWLTKEPEPEVIVIDLRETWTVGPILALLERTGHHVHHWYQDSGSQRIIQQTESQFQQEPVRLLSAILIGLVVVTAGLKFLAGGLSTTVILGVGVALTAGVLGLFVDLTWDELVETRPVQLLIRALEPPEPPES